MISTKTVADVLTLIRLLIALFIFWLSLSGDPVALPTVVVAVVIGWATDLLDGPLARRGSSGRRTWIGDNDLGVDVTVALALLSYLTASGYVSAEVALAYLALCLTLLWRFRSRALAMACQAPPYGTMLYNALRYAPSYGALAVGWIALTVIGTWPRFPKVIVPEFLRGMRELWGGEDS